MLCCTECVTGHSLRHSCGSKDTSSRGFTTSSFQMRWCDREGLTRTTQRQQIRSQRGRAATKSLSHHGGTENTEKIKRRRFWSSLLRGLRASVVKIDVEICSAQQELAKLIRVNPGLQLQPLQVLAKIFLQ